jgi:hypothetical protein
MKTALAFVRQMLPFLVAGAVTTVFVAWGLPLMFAARGSGAWGEPTRYWFSTPSSGVKDERPGAIGIDIPATVGAMPVIEVHRGILSDWYVARRSGDGTSWPSGTLEDLAFEHSLEPVPRVPAAYVAVTPPPGDETRYARIDTGVAGWPFRAFRGESLFIASDKPDGYEPMPELRGNWNLGLVHGRLLLVPFEPLWAGILGNVVFWSSVTWMAIAFPVAIRNRRREKYGKCVKCGYAMDVHAVKRPEVCPECGTRFRRDPLGFAHSPEMHFQNDYVWIIFVSSLDIMLTWKILDAGGIEVNPVAALVIDEWGMHGAIAFKFALMMWVIVICEVLARLRRRAGKFLAVTAIVISASPVVWSLFLLSARAISPE